MKATINIEDIISPKYFENEENAEGTPCIICGKSVSKIEAKYETLLEAINNGDSKAIKWHKDNYIHMTTNGNLYLVDEQIGEGEESFGCHPIGCTCMKKYRAMRFSN